MAIGGRAWSAPSLEPGDDPTPHPDISLPVEGVHVITNPDWVSVPNGDDFANDYPPLAAAMGLGGHVVLHCAVATDGALQTCQVYGETPRGMGFGAAAIGMSSVFRMRPQTLDGRPVSGGLINIPIHFQPAADDAPAPPGTDGAAKAASPESLALAHRLAVAVHWDTQAVAEVQKNEALLTEQAEQQGLTSEQSIALNSFRAASDDYVRAQLQIIEARLAAAFTDAEMTKLINFFGSPLGQAWFSRVGEMQKLEGGDVKSIWATMMRLARARFCQQVTCYDNASTGAASAAPSPAK